jgi:transcriptional regulator with XRE-family HTH domain
MSSFGERLNQLRKTNNLKAEDLADIAGVKRRIIFMYEKGDAKPSFDVLIALADYFNVSLDFLVGRSNSSARNK